MYLLQQIRLQSPIPQVLHGCAVHSSDALHALVALKGGEAHEKKI